MKGHKMSDKKLKELKTKVLSLLTDKNVGFVDYEGDNEMFGVILAYTKAFREVDKVFNEYGI